jgi:hypothetical protein
MYSRNGYEIQFDAAHADGIEPFSKFRVGYGFHAREGKMSYLCLGFGKM